MAEPENMVLVLLREMRADMTREFKDVKTQIREVDARLVAPDLKVDNVKQAAFGESLVGRYMAAEVEERLAAIEARLAALEDK
jgi:hypothetical protein